MISGLSQPLLAAATLKWAFFWMLAYATFARAGSTKLYFLGAFLLELALGVGGYFSDFKTVMFFTLFAAVAGGLRSRRNPSSASPCSGRWSSAPASSGRPSRRTIEISPAGASAHRT